MSKNSNNDAESYLEDVSGNITKAEKESGKIIFSESKRIGVGIGPSRNQIDNSGPQKNVHDANVMAAYRDSRLEQESDHTGMSEEEIDDITEGVVDEYIKEFIDKDIFGL